MPDEMKRLKAERLQACWDKLQQLCKEQPAVAREEHAKAAVMVLVTQYEIPHPLAKKYLALMEESGGQVSDAAVSKLTDHDDMHGSRFMVLPNNVEQIMKGNKQMSRRFRRWLDPGDTFSVHGKRFKAVRVEKIKVGQITEEDIKKEGYASKADFEAMWYKSHPKSVAAGKTLDPEQNCWCHEYEEA